MTSRYINITTFHDRFQQTEQHASIIINAIAELVIPRVSRVLTTMISVVATPHIWNRLPPYRPTGREGEEQFITISRKANCNCNCNCSSVSLRDVKHICFNVSLFILLLHFHLFRIKLFVCCP